MNQKKNSQIKLYLITRIEKLCLIALIQVKCPIVLIHTYPMECWRRHEIIGIVNGDLVCAPWVPKMVSRTHYRGARPSVMY